MKKQNHYYFKDDIRKTLLIYAIIPVVLLTLVCLLIFWGAWLFSSINTCNTDNITISNNLELTINSYMKVINELTEQENLKNKTIDVSGRVEIFESLYDVSNKLERKAKLYVFDNKLNPIISATKNLPEYFDGQFYLNWGIFRIMNETPDEIAIKFLRDETSESMQLLLGKTIVKNGNIVGYVLIVIDSKQFQYDLANIDSQIVITNDYGSVLVANNIYFINKMNRFELSNGKVNGFIKSKQGTYYIKSNNLFDNRIHVYSILSLNKITTIFGYISIILLFVFTIMILAIYTSTKTMAIKKTKDLYTILEAFEKVKQGDLNTYIDITSKDEWGIIGEAYNLMLDSLKEQIEANKEMERLVATSQVKQLESQFNPHFLFNTLENIRFMCKLDSLSASKMIFSLSNLLRYSISNTQQEVTVKEDVLYTENYMNILKYRFNERFNYSIDLPESVEKCVIPKLILQPMIENAIKYGFEGRASLTIKVTGYIKNDLLTLSCYDDGAGIEPAILKELEDILQQNTNKSIHTGLYNIHRRIQLKYGKKYGINIESELGQYTIVRAILPVQYEKIEGGQSC